MPSPTRTPEIVVIGLGYVGLPLAVALAKHFPVTGYDIDASRVDELKRGHDRTDEIAEADLTASTITLTSDAASCPPADFYIVTVPTPVDADNRPDLTILEKASASVGKMIDGSRKPVIVFESTVYPGVTEDVCGPIIAQTSGLTRGEDFFLGYSPERINPGDREHTIDRITKVIAGENDQVTDMLAEVYGRATTGGTFRAASIKVAEAAKVIENAQRDINIAFINEVTRIFFLLDISVWDVLAAANTKWNFLPFKPGLVGGHCIGVDPYYLSHRAEQLGHNPAVILAGRSINDTMGGWVADRLTERLAPGARVLVLGLTFKEDVPDLRNSKVVDVITRLKANGHAVDVHDPRASAEQAHEEYGIDLVASPERGGYDGLLLAVAHADYLDAGGADLAGYLREGGLFADLKGAVARAEVPAGYDYWGI